jgi:hypothetical protein
LVDTPGFDDTNMEDGTILEKIARWLGDSYDQDMRLSGLIYMHDIHEARVGRSSVKNMRLFEKLTGHDSMQNVVLLTTKWDSLPDPDLGYRREDELGRTYGFWRTMLADGAEARRHNGTKESAERVVLSLLDRTPPPSFTFSSKWLMVGL